MCGQFTVLTYDEVLDVIQEIENYSPCNVMPDWPAVRFREAEEAGKGSSTAGNVTRPTVVPSMHAPIIIPQFDTVETRQDPSQSPDIASDSPAAEMPIDSPSLELSEKGSTAESPIDKPSVKSLKDDQAANGSSARHLTAGTLAAVTYTWGYQVQWQKGVIFNTRFDSLGKSLWRDSALHRRCLVPCFSFFEPHQSEMAISPRTSKPFKRPYEFFIPGSVMLLGGIFQDERFSIVTTEPNASIEPVHDRMPLVLQPSDIPTWFSEDWPSLEDRSQIKLESQPTLPLWEPDAPTPKQGSLF